MDDSINGSDYGILNWDTPTRVPQNTEQSLPDVSLESTSLNISCSWQTRLVTRETRRKSLEIAQTFTADLVMREIKSCRNSKSFGPDKLSIFHLKYLGARANR